MRDASVLVKIGVYEDRRRPGGRVVCLRCRLAKIPEEFRAEPRVWTGVRSECRACELEKKRLARRGQTPTPKELAGRRRRDARKVARRASPSPVPVAAPPAFEPSPDQIRAECLEIRRLKGFPHA